jgi:hypothetical protein
MEVECPLPYRPSNVSHPKESTMPDIARPTTYAGKLALVQRLVRSAQFRTDPKLAIRELCEAMGELTAALLEREPAQEGAAPAENPQ